MSSPLDRAAQIVDAAQQLDHLADAARTVTGLRNRARTARIKAAKSGPVRRAFWTWRANVLSERAAVLAAERGLTGAP